MSQNLPASIAQRLSAVLPAIRQAAERTGADFAGLLSTARVESGLDPAAKAAGSSATGLFQFIDSTWLSMLSKHGGRHGITPSSRAEALGLRSDPYVSSLMAAEYMAENRAVLRARLGRDVGAPDLYLAHFLGSGGAARFLTAMAADPGASAAPLFPAAARSNRAIFYSGGRERSLAEVHATLSGRLDAAGGTKLPAPPPSPGTPVPGGLPSGLAARLVALGDDAAPPPDPRLAAQAAYLLLAELGI